jgi:hypothetical protein
MRVFNAVRFYGRTAVLVVVMTGALGGTASAAVKQLTLDPSAQLSPGRLHAYLTGTITCDPGDSLSLSGQVVQLKGGSGVGSTTFVCDGTPQTYTMTSVVAAAFPSPSLACPGSSSQVRPAHR